MGLMDTLGINKLGISMPNFSSILSIGTKFLLVIGLIIFIALIFGYWYYLRSKNKRQNIEIYWFEETNGNMIPLKMDKAEELTVPNTQIKLFYIEAQNMYLPRGTRKMGKNSYWYAIRNNREIVNFSLTNINEEMKKANIDYDHTDMRYAYTNLTEIIKRNYRDKATPWWREYKDVIAVVILVFIMTLSFLFIMYKLGGLIGQISGAISQISTVAQSLADIIKQLKVGSGVVTAIT